MNKISYKDQYGVEIKVGDVINYPVRRGSCLWMSTAVVVELRKKTRDRSETFFPILGVVSKSGSYRGLVRRVEVHSLSACTVISKDDIRDNEDFKDLIEAAKKLGVW